MSDLNSKETFVSLFDLLLVWWGIHTMGSGVCLNLTIELYCVFGFSRSYMNSGRPITSMHDEEPEKRRRVEMLDNAPDLLVTPRHTITSQ
ncbi:hypothetical protein C490_13775 [Natronobacterium gregoryi SP2]|uniref:Uncharacterized protein n=1 Tax=Natronobacterium gregoryi (strain ATCC 43098 / DSM 3393 / CCM 3738 / CIP 104747 / IAM 13177 / JCM 8860 / NBRC 102187 / NCIMB 2189 / SP2) TaxID=797304 RepID=L9XUR3_NATGS|nr:hypothetical protein C490_13775 [Natronobacterium gregoryi SP2]